MYKGLFLIGDLLSILWQIHTYKIAITADDEDKDELRACRSSKSDYYKL